MTATLRKKTSWRLADAAAQMWSRTDSGAIVYIGYDTREGAEQAARLAGMVVAGAGLVAHDFRPLHAYVGAVLGDCKRSARMRRPDDYGLQSFKRLPGY